MVYIIFPDICWCAQREWTNRGSGGEYRYRIKSNQFCSFRDFINLYSPDNTSLWQCHVYMNARDTMSAVAKRVIISNTMHPRTVDSSWSSVKTSNGPTRQSHVQRRDLYGLAAFTPETESPEPHKNISGSTANWFVSVLTSSETRPESPTRGSSTEGMIILLRIASATPTTDGTLNYRSRLSVTCTQGSFRQISLGINSNTILCKPHISK